MLPKLVPAPSFQDTGVPADGNAANRAGTPRARLLVAAAVLRRAGKILITKRPQSTSMAGLWEFPGGKVEPGESPRAAVVRECREECDIEIEAGSIIEVAHHITPKKDIVLMFFECILLSGDVKHVGVAEHRWVTAAQLNDFSFPPADESLIALLSAGGP